MPALLHSHPTNCTSRLKRMTAGGLAVVLAAATWPPGANAAEDSNASNLISSITQEVIWDNSDGEGISWFHPRVCIVPENGKTPQALMTLQSIGGSDYFGPVQFSASTPDATVWSKPQPIPALGWEPIPDSNGLKAGVCDVVPQHHRKTNTVLAMGHVVFYRGAKFNRGEQLARYPVYSVRGADGSWSERRILKWDDPRGAFIYTNNCGQRINLPNGDILLAFTFGDKAEHRSVAGVRCSFDGEHLKIREVGPAIEHKVKRGLLEPSLAQYNKRFFLTMRAEDNKGYVSSSEDGLNWTEKKAWSWDDGSPITMSTTQQHWLTHSDGLFLVYTRKHESNANVIRWRAPLFMAQVNPDTLTLLRETEQVVHPIAGDGVNDANSVPLMGNFNTTNATAMESWVTVGSWAPRKGARGQVLLARIKWNRPNRLVD